MSSATSTFSAITSISKQRVDIISDNRYTDKLQKLKKLINELEKEKKEYLKTNQRLTENTKLIYQQNQALKESINDRTALYEHILDKYSRSTRTLQTAIDNNNKMSKIYQEYKSKINNTQEIKDDSIYDTEIAKIDKEIKNIQNSANDLINKFHESEKKIFDYKILLSLESKLTKISILFTNEAKNCISVNPCFFSNSRLGQLQQKIKKGFEIKKELSLFDIKDEKEKHEVTEYVLKNFSEKLDRSLSIYNQILLISEKRCLMMSEDDLFDSSESVKSNSSSSTRRSRLFKSNKIDDEKISFGYEKVESKIHKKIELDFEIFELKRIVGIDGFDYLNDPEREENYRKIKSLFVPGLNNIIFKSEESTESYDSEKENNEEKLLDSEYESECEEEEEEEEEEENSQQSENTNEIKHDDTIENEKNNNINNEKNDEKICTIKVNRPEKEESFHTKSDNDSEQSKSENYIEQSEKVDQPQANKTNDLKIKENSQTSTQIEDQFITNTLIDKNPDSYEDPKQPEIVEQPHSASNNIDLPLDPDKSIQEDTEQMKNEPKIQINAQDKDEEKSNLSDNFEMASSSGDLEGEFSSDKFFPSHERSQKSSEEGIKPLIPLKYPYKFEHSMDFKLEEFDEQLEEELEKEKITIQLTLLELSTKSTQKEKEEPPKITVKKPISLLVRPNKARQLSIAKRNQKRSEESDSSSTEFILEIDQNQSETIDNIIHSSDHSQQQQEKEKIEPLAPSKNPYSLLVHPDRKNQRSIAFISPKVNDESDCETEFILKEPEPEPEIPKNEPKNNDQQTDIKNPVSISLLNLKNTQKKPQKVSTYDRSVFYNPSTYVVRSTFEIPRIEYKVPLTVSLKDIGLEGFDSCSIEKMKELQRIQKFRKEEAKNKKKSNVVVENFGERNRGRIYSFPSSDVVCKLNLYEKNISTTRKNERISSSKRKNHPIESYAESNQKPESLLNSTQKIQKTQTIKPKAPPKSSHKINV